MGTTKELELLSYEEDKVDKQKLIDSIIPHLKQTLVAISSRLTSNKLYKSDIESFLAAFEAVDPKLYQFWD